ncbi:MAG: TRAP transporter TatT component family protein [Dokdonella sp.]|uniref:TRAP transporter TatT component family protein n=1 Tax=Dokdonella sp. TaxID=2291710 RepID=UPI003265A8D6
MTPIRSKRLLLAVCVLTLVLGGCASVVNRATQRLADDLSAGILDQDDLATAREGVPAWLLLIDGLIQGAPQNANLLIAGSRLYDSYGSAFVDDPERAKRLTARSFGYARRATCVRLVPLCQQLDAPFEAFHAEVSKVDVRNIAMLYQLASSWAGRLQANSADWKAIADLPKIQLLVERVVALDPSYGKGEPYMILGVLATLRPASLGGRPEEGKADFEKALALSGGNNQMVRVLYAEHYARLVFDQPLHDRLLNEAINADPHAPGLTLINTVAQMRARKLLESGKDYF